MAIITYLSIITSNVNGLMLQSKDTECQIEWKNKTKPRTCNMLPTWDSLQGERPTQTKREEIKNKQLKKMETIRKQG